MSEIDPKSSEEKYRKWIVALSIAIPLAVAALFGVNLKKMGFDVEPFTFLPPIYAAINGVTAIGLIAAFFAIKNGKRKLHEGLMKFNIVLSVLFLLGYVAYHMTAETTIYEGTLGVIYYPLLFSHIILSIVVIPFVLFTYVRGITRNFEKHKKIARIAFPIWLFVAVSGVVVYLMISPYYG